MIEPGNQTPVAELPENGDVYCSHGGEYLGSIDTSYLAKGTKECLHIQIMHEGEWLVYQLQSIQPLEPENAKGTDQTHSD